MHTQAANDTSTRDPDLDLLDRYWRAANYLSVGQIYLLAHPLLREPLAPEHIKPRLLGHWGTTPGLNFLYAHLNRVIRASDLNVLYVCGPGHGGPGMVANTYLEGTYSEIYPDIGRDAEGNRIGRPRIDLVQVPVLPDHQFCKKRMVAQVVDDNFLELAAEVADHVGQQIVRERPGRLDVLDAPVDAGRLEDADDDGEAALAVHLAQHDHLLVVDLVDDNALQLHLDGHGSLSFDSGGPDEGA